MKRIMKWPLILVLLALVAFSPAANKEFPELTGKSLNGKSITIPRDTKGRFAVIGMAYSQAAQEDLNTWIEPVSKHLVGNRFFPINLFFVPMTGDVKIMSQAKIEEKMKETMDKSYYDYVLLYQGDNDPYIKGLNMKDKKTAYFFVLDPEGKVTYSTSGKYTEQKLEAITDALSE